MPTFALRQRPALAKTIPAQRYGHTQTPAQLCQRAGVAKLDAGPRGATVSFHNKSFSNPGGLVEFLSKQSGTAKLRPDHTLVLMRDWADDKKRVRGALDLVKALAGIAAKAA